MTTKPTLRAIVGAVVVIGVLILLIFQFGGFTTFRATDADIRSDRMIAMGFNVYQQNCASCHGVELEGQPEWRSRNSEGKLPAPPHNEEGHTWHHPDEVLFEITKFGPSIYAGADYQSDMPAYKDILSDEEIWASLVYIKSRWPEQIRRKQDQINEKSSR